MRHKLIASILIALALPGCLAAAAGVGAGIIFSQEMDANTYTYFLEKDADVVWATAKASLSHQATEIIEPDEDLRTVTARIDNADVVVSVELHDLDRCALRVSARKFGVANGELAEMVIDEIVRDLER
ncbi:MAG: hypothetical protein CMJ84_09310 [Planctomycetes bacterium]|jgi:hypothetical protein|nr:hypothetical protein [Planctomycetota bacterium]MDP6407869.1 hypothetical protein [Planctomycetota bacterium]